MFTGNETTARNPAGGGLLTLLAVVGLGYGAYKVFFAPVASAAPTPTPGPTPDPQPDPQPQPDPTPDPEPSGLPPGSYNLRLGESYKLQLPRAAHSARWKTTQGPGVADLTMSSSNQDKSIWYAAPLAASATEPDVINATFFDVGNPQMATPANVVANYTFYVKS